MKNTRIPKFRNTMRATTTKRKTERKKNGIEKVKQQQQECFNFRKSNFHDRYTQQGLNEEKVKSLDREMSSLGIERGGGRDINMEQN